MAAQCRSCGGNNRDGARFCTHCGARLESGDASPSATTRARTRGMAGKIGLIAFAAGKSLALSALVLSPGGVLLYLGMTLAGLAWMFAGSFALMAWTYRKPWRLGAVSCLLPPLAALACYALQLWLLGDSLPPAALLGGAVALGLAVGFLRGKAHRIYRQGDAAFAQRTIAYLLIWVVAYAATQALALASANLWAIRGGLATGAFSTAMLAVVSVMVWQQKARIFAVRAAPAMAGALAMLLAFGALALAAPGLAQSERETENAEGGGEVGAAGALQVLNDLLPRLQSTIETFFDSGVERIASDRPAGNDDRASVKFLVHDAMTAEDNGATLAEGDIECILTIERFADSGQAGIEAPAGARTISGKTPDGTSIDIVLFDTGDADYGRAAAVRGPYRLTFEMRRLSWVDHTGRGVGYTPDEWQGGVVAVITFAFEHLRTDLVPENRPDEEVALAPGDAGIAAGLGPELTEEEEAALTAVVATLLAAGIGINTAQAIAAALAATLQATGQITAEDIQAAIAEGLLEEEDEPDEAQRAQPEPRPPPPPIYRPNGEPFETNDRGEYLAPDENGDWRWMSEAEARRSAAALQREEGAKAGERALHERVARADLDRSNAGTRARHGAEREAELREHSAREDLERIRRGADRTGHDEVWERAHADNLYNADGTIDLEQLARLRQALRGRISRDNATADPDFGDNSWTRIVRETTSQSFNDARDSFLVRGGLGLASGGWSEALFQGAGTWDAIRAEAERAADKDEAFSGYDAMSTAAGEFARNNLPVNTYTALTRDGEPAGWGELGMSLLADAAAMLDVAETGTRLTGVTAGDAAERLGRRVLGENALARASDAAGAAGKRIGDTVESVAARVRDLDNRATDAINRMTGGAARKIGLDAPDGPAARAARLAAQRAALADARARFDGGELAANTRAVIDDVRAGGATATLDEAFEAGRAQGRQQVEAFENSLEDLQAARASGSASADEIAALERRVRDEMVRIQGDKHAMNALNGRNVDGGGSLTIEEFNREMARVHAQTDRRVIERLAEQYGVRPEDIQIVTITNQRGTAAGVDPAAPGRPSHGLASEWTPDGSVQGSRAARSEPGTIDGPETGRLPTPEAKPPSRSSAGMDRDLTIRVRSIDAQGNVIYRDVPSTVTGRVYNEEFFEVATGRSRADLADGGGHHASTDFKDTHLTAQQFTGDPLGIDDPQAFARRMDQATTDRLHPEAYGTGQGDLDTATKDAFRGRDLSDAAGTAKTIEYKVDHWMTEARRLEELAALPENAAIRDRLLAQSAAHVEEAQRQLVKQHGNMVLNRTEAMVSLGNLPDSARIPDDLIEKVNLLKQVRNQTLTPAQAEAALRAMGSSTQDLARQMSAYVEGLQTLRPPPAPHAGLSRPATVVQGWQDDFAPGDREDRDG